MGLFGSLFGSKSTTDVPKWAKPYIVQGLQSTQNVFNEQQPKLDAMSQTAQDAFSTIAPGAFNPNDYVKGAQDSAASIYGGDLLGKNPGQATYDRMQAEGGYKSASPDPSMGALSYFAAGGGAGGAGDAAMARAAYGQQNNPAQGYAAETAGGGYLNGQPSAGVYAGMMDPNYSTANPFIDQMVKQASNNALTQTNRLFSSRGMGTGMSTPYAAAAAGATANAENNIRYQNYNDAEARKLQAAGQSDSAWNSERDRMGAADQLMSSIFNTNQDRALSAAQSLSQGSRQDTQNQLSAAQALGGQYTADENRALDAFNTGQDRALNAASSADTVQGNQVQQILSALGLTSGLRTADYAGVAPALDLLTSAAQIPWVGVNAYNGGVSGLTRGYSTSTATPSVMGAVGQLASVAGAASDRRLKANIEKVGEFDDGLGVYDFDYRDPARFGEGRHRGVMADEIASLRPWALGAKIDGEYSTVHYGAL